ncbi:hypothetical protein PVAP13_9NG076173, partial [Panicum virgatum]
MKTTHRWIRRQSTAVAPHTVTKKPQPFPRFPLSPFPPLRYTCLTYSAHATPRHASRVPPARPPEHRTEPTHPPAHAPAQQRLAATGKAKFPVTSERLPAASGQVLAPPLSPAFHGGQGNDGERCSATARTRGSGREGTGQGQPATATHGRGFLLPPPPIACLSTLLRPNPIFSSILLGPPR